MSDKRDFYEVLGVSRDADQRTIKRAFLKKAREVHPDVSDDPEAEERFKELNEAYSVLSDEQKRANYDRFGTADGSGGFVDFGDIFSGMGMDDIFSSFFGQSQRSGRQSRREGRDMAIGLSITLEEAARGCSKTIAYDRLGACDACGGSGSKDGGGETACPRCHGTGFVTTVQRSIFGQVQSSSPCPDCHGEGSVVEHACETCSGQGRVVTHERIEVQVPAGVDTGSQIRIAGHGEAGLRGAAAGDLIASVQVLDHDRFIRQGDDLLCEIQISMVQAALGGTVEVQGIMQDEVVTIEVPAGTQFADQLVVQNFGMPRRRGAGRGRLIAQARIEIPRKLTGSQREALQAFAATLEEPSSAHRSVGERIRDAIDDILD